MGMLIAFVAGVLVGTCITFYYADKVIEELGNAVAIYKQRLERESDD